MDIKTFYTLENLSTSLERLSTSIERIKLIASVDIHTPLMDTYFDIFTFENF